MGNENRSQLEPDRLTTMLVKQPAPFLSKTWSLLEDHQNSSLISWSASGDSFVVPQPDAFARELLPTVFKHNNYTSFVRQLNIYGFRKLPAPHQEFCHPCFKRGQPQLLSQIHRGGMANVPSQEGPGSEIAALKGQVDKLSKALSYTLAELHRQGYETLRFDWKELVFIDPNSAMQAPLVSKTDPGGQVSVTTQKSDMGDMQPIKMQRTDGTLEPSVVPLPQLQQPALMQAQPPFQPGSITHAIPAPAATPTISSELQNAIPPSVLGPYMQMHPHEVSMPADQQQNSVPMHAVQSSAQAGGGIAPMGLSSVPTASGGNCVPAPPTEVSQLYDLPPPQVDQNQGAAVRHPGVASATLSPVPYQHQHQAPMDVSAAPQQPVHNPVHDGSGQQAYTTVVQMPGHTAEGKPQEQMYSVGDHVSAAVPDAVVPDACQQDMHQTAPVPGNGPSSN